jgi:glutamate--cysteine ligase
MPTSDKPLALTIDQAMKRAGDTAFPPPADRDTGAMGIGLEPEYFPVFRGPDGRPAGRVPLHDPDAPGVLDIIDGMVCEDAGMESRRGGPIGPWEYPMAGGSRLTFEPGAQVEHSTGIYDSACAAVEGAQRVLDCLRARFSEHGVVIAAAGMDIWHDVETVPQQLPFGRYTAQASYYERRGRWGRVMMCHTASLQINLDLGPDGVWQERWLAANLISPIITATFACSPGPEGVSSRARAWQQLDPTRSGFPSTLVDSSVTEPGEQWAHAAMAADVMLFRTADGHWHPGEPGFTFGRWIKEGHPVHGRPTIEDLDYHLTTLFFEVRPRGFLELRAGEQLPDCWRAAEVALIIALLYDDRARNAFIQLISDRTSQLPDLWVRGATAGLADGELHDLAMTAWDIALKGAERLAGVCIGNVGLECARRFVEEFVVRGRTPADRLRELHEEDPAKSLAWAASEL